MALFRGQIAGMVALNCGDSKLDQPFVAPEWQRQGIGRLLVNAAKEHLPKGMWLKSHRQNSDAVLFYQAQGFVLDLERSGGSDAPDDVFYRWVPALLD